MSATQESQEHQDQSTWIRVCGILLAVGAVLGLLGSVFTVIVVPEAAAAGNRGPEQALQGLFFCSIALWIGIELVRMRRWARDVLLAASIVSLVVGGSGLPVMLIGAGSFPSSQANGGALLLGMGCCCGGLLLVPAFVAYFLSRPSVERTLREHSPEPTFTDRCPMQVLWLCAYMFTTGATTAFMRPVAAWGTVLAAWPAAAHVCALATLHLLCGWLLYRLRAAGWYIGFLICALQIASCLLNALYLNPEEYMSKALGPSKASFAVPQVFATGQWTYLLFHVGLAGYLIYARKYIGAHVDEKRIDGKDQDQSQ